MNIMGGTAAVQRPALAADAKADPLYTNDPWRGAAPRAQSPPGLRRVGPDDNQRCTLVIRGWPKRISPTAKQSLWAMAAATVPGLRQLSPVIIPCADTPKMMLRFDTPGTREAALSALQGLPKPLELTWARRTFSLRASRQGEFGDNERRWLVSAHFEVIQAAAQMYPAAGVARVAARSKYRKYGELSVETAEGEVFVVISADQHQIWQGEAQAQLMLQGLGITAQAVSQGVADRQREAKSRYSSDPYPDDDDY